MKGISVLRFDQLQDFRETGLITQHLVNDQVVPEYAFTGTKSRAGAEKDSKLFPKNISNEDLLYLYLRCDIAGTAIDTPARDVWSKGFKIKAIDEKGGEIQDSPLEKAIYQLNKEHKILAAFEEAHRYSRLFGLGIVVMGLADGKKIKESVDKAQSLSFVRAFSDMEIDELKFDKIRMSEHFGKIETYDISIAGDIQTKFSAHRDRVVHVMEKTKLKNARGISVLEGPFDLFQVLKNTDWSAGEAYYQNASPLFVLTWEGEEVPPKDEKEQMKTDIEDLHAKKRIIMPAAYKLEAIQGSGQLPDPGNVWGPIIKRIAGAVNIPEQILLGTSAGALASGETNLQQYYKDIAGVQVTFAEPLLVDFYTRLQRWGILPEGRFEIEWASLWQMSERDTAIIDYRKMQRGVLALGSAQRGIPALMTVQEIRHHILGLPLEFEGGKPPVMKTDIETNAPATHILSISTQALTRTFESLINQARDGVPVEKILEEANVAIKYHVNLSRENALQYVERDTGRSIGMLPPEMESEFDKLERDFTKSFSEILEDSLKDVVLE